MNSHNVVLVGPFPEDASIIRGGVQASVYGLVRALLHHKDIASLRVFSLPLKILPNAAVKRHVLDGVDVTYLHAPYRFQASSITHLPRVVRSIYDLENTIIHIHGTGLFQAALCAVMRMKRVACIWTLHGITEKETLQRYREKRSPANGVRYLFYTALERFLLRIAPSIIVDTPYVKAAVGAGTRIQVIPQGIFTEEFKNEKDIRRDKHLIVSVGVISPRKGHHLTLEAFAHVKGRLPEARLIIAGIVSQQDYFELLAKRADELGIKEDVEFRVNARRSEIIDLLFRARVFTLHSEEESQGIALCEALAAGLPVVATSVGGIPFVVEDKKSGFLVPLHDTQMAADRIIRLLTDDALHANMSACALISADRFDWQAIAQEISVLYRRAFEWRVQRR